MKSEPESFGAGESDSEKEPRTGPSPKLDHLIEELRAQFAAELKSEIEKIRKECEERLSEKAAQWETQRTQLMEEIEELRRKSPSQLVQDEISATEAVMKASQSKTSRELERLIPDAAVLGRLLQIRVEELEMKAYLRGLKFRSDKDR